MAVQKRPLVEAYWLGYAATQQFGGQALDLSRIPSATPVDVVKIAFYNVFPNNGISVCFGMSESHDWKYTAAGIQTLQAAGIKVLASLNSTPDLQVGWNDIPDPQAFAANVKILLIDYLGCDGIDIDNEDDDPPGPAFVAAVKALRSELGAKGSDKALLTCVTYQADRDLPWLKQVGGAFDWVSTMAYWDNTQQQIGLYGQYAAVLGPSNVLIGVGCPGCAYPGQESTLETVKGVAQWETGKGVGATGGMMLWCLSAGGPTQQYYTAIRQNLTIWKPPGAG